MISQRTILGKLRQLKTNSAFAAIRSNASATVIVERPKVVYCPKTSRYVMYFHLDHRQERRPHYHWRLVAVATAEHPNVSFTPTLDNPTRAPRLRLLLCRRLKPVMRSID